MSGILTRVLGASVLSFQQRKESTKESAGQKNRSAHKATARLPFFGWLCFFSLCVKLVRGLKYHTFAEKMKILQFADYQ
jgi:hypothetical protein